jgi:PIN domain nuclease of toxin-antitoxin system
LSAASIWEIRIKSAKGKLALNFDDVPAEARRRGFRLLSISPEHAQLAGDLPKHHEDPFDRMLVAQARIEALPIVTGDAAFSPYRIPIVWTA